MNNLKTILSLTFALILAGIIMAQEVKFTASSSKNTVALDEQFKLTFKVNQQGSGFQPPAMNDFRLYSGPNKSSNMQWVNGVMSSSLTYTYILSPKKVGKLKIGPAKIKVDGKIVESNVLEIKGVKASNKPVEQKTKPQGSASGNNTNKSLQEQIKKNVFLKAFTSKVDPYVGEQVVATYKLYYRVDIVDLQADKLPSFKGFSTKEVDTKKNQITQEVVNGVRYNVAMIHQAVLFPQRSGALEIDPLEIKTVIRVRTSNRGQSIFDHFWGSFQNVEHRTKSRSLKLKVKALPDGAPDSFEGAVGTFTYSATIDKDSAAVNDAINLRVEMNGKGNINLLPEPTFAFPPDFEVYDPKVNVNSNVNAGGVRGKKSYEYLIIPRHAGKFEIKGKGFSYFDPERHDYVKVPGNAFTIQIGKVDDEGELVSSSFSNSRKEVIKSIGRDIRFIHTGNIQLTEKGTGFFNSLKYYGLLGGPFALVFVLLIVRRRIGSISENSNLIKRRRANTLANKHLAKAQEMLKKGEFTTFYDELSIALYGYIGDKLAMDTSDMTRARMLDTLKDQGVDEQMLHRANALLDQCEMARFAPARDLDANKLFGEAKDLLKNLEDKLS